MITINQLIRKNRKTPPKKLDRVLCGAPQRSATCIKVYTAPPKKPNSANRQCTRVIFAKSPVKNAKKEAIVYIPYEKHNLKAHSNILVRKGNKVDLPGVGFIAIRGNRDLAGVGESRQARSLKGNKKPKA